MLKYMRYNIVRYLRANVMTYFFLILILVVGVVVGSLAVKILPEEQKTELISYLQVFFQGLAQQDGSSTDSAAMLASVLYRNCKTILIIWLLGFTIIGIPFVLFILFTRGFVIGFTVGFLINEYILKGMVFALTAVLPHNFLAVPAVLITAVSAASFSLMLVRRKKHGKVNLFYEAFSYSLLCVLMLVVMVTACFVEVYISPILMKTAAGVLFKGVYKL